MVKGGNGATKQLKMEVCNFSSHICRNKVSHFQETADLSEIYFCIPGNFYQSVWFINHIIHCQKYKCLNRLIKQPSHSMLRSSGIQFCNHLDENPKTKLKVKNIYCLAYHSDKEKAEVNRNRYVCTHCEYSTF